MKKRPMRGGELPGSPEAGDKASNEPPNELYLSLRTVEGHVGNILTRLRLPLRGEIAREVTGHLPGTRSTAEVQRTAQLRCLVSPDELIRSRFTIAVIGFWRCERTVLRVIVQPVNAISERLSRSLESRQVSMVNDIDFGAASIMNLNRQATTSIRLRHSSRL